MDGPFFRPAQPFEQPHQLHPQASFSAIEPPSSSSSSSSSFISHLPPSSHPSQDFLPHPFSSFPPPPHHASSSSSSSFSSTISNTFALPTSPSTFAPPSPSQGCGYSSNDDDGDDDDELHHQKPKKGGKSTRSSSSAYLLPPPSPRTSNDPGLLQVYRQERNRLAAKRSRERKKDYIRQLESTCRALKAHNDELGRDLTKLRRELAQIMTASSSSSGPSAPASSTSMGEETAAAAPAVAPATKGQKRTKKVQKKV